MQYLLNKNINQMMTHVDEMEQILHWKVDKVKMM